jgi:hypothetical protein
MRALEEVHGMSSIGVTTWTLLIGAYDYYWPRSERRTLAIAVVALESDTSRLIDARNSIVRPQWPIAQWRKVTMNKNERKTALSVIALMAAFGTASWAQQPAATPGQSQAQPTQPTAAQGPWTLRKLYARADKNGDGKVTKDEAKGHLPNTYANFEAIDTDKRGYITFDQFMAYVNKRTQKQADDILHQGDQYH